MKRNDKLALAFLTALGLWVFAPGLGHPMIVSWDEGAHQAVTRGLHDTWQPVIYRDPLVPIADDDWFNAGVFLHKPTLPFFLGALVMQLVGVTPLALRLVSLCGEIGAALVIFFVSRRELGRLLGVMLAAGFLLLPFGWQLVQGLQFGDVTDCSLIGFICVSFLLLIRAIERDSDRDALMAGVACGLAYLCKSALALAPLGVAAVFALLHATGAARGLRWQSAAALVGAALVVAAPWNVYCAFRWPAVYDWESGHTLAHLSTGVGPWRRPLDALFNEIGSKELTAVPLVFFLLAGLWVLRVAWRERTPTAIATALWLWGEWIPLSYAKAKVPATMWCAVPAMLLAAGFLLRDSWRSPTLALATLGAILSPQLERSWPGLSAVRMLVPNALPQTRAMPGLAEGLALAAMGFLLGWVLTRAVGQHRRWPGTVTVAAAAFALLVSNPHVLAEMKAKEHERFPVSYTQVVGEAISTHTPDRSVLFLDLANDPPCCAEKQNLMFWSGRMAYPPKPELVSLARERGYHPYLVSSVAEPYERLAAVPAGAWLQAFDLDRPATLALLPADLRRPKDDAGSVLGVGIDATIAGQGRYSLYLRPGAASGPVSFESHSKTVAATMQSPLVTRTQLSNAPWFEVPLLGPPTADASSFRIGDTTVDLEPPARPVGEP